jgi:hypothetical protein
MISFHGWIVLSCDPTEIDDEKEEALVTAFQDYIKKEHAVLVQEDLGYLIRHKGWIRLCSRDITIPLLIP